jgi:predicted small secreted protein|tara:strand:+ start:33240 stop:33416 length:177 start_codon:yes stop_codon:yes gene_type:complete
MNTREAVAQESSLTTRLGALLAAAVLATVGVSLTGCNTTEGVGQDIEAAGEGIQDAAD